MKHPNDKYYTSAVLAKRLIDTTFSVLADEEITDIIEPSAGAGGFSSLIKCTAYDIEPEGENIIKADFLTVPIEYQKGRLCIGNPPFGNRNSLSMHFYKKCCNIGDFIAFIQPISQLNNNLQMYEFDLLHSEDLGIHKYSGVPLHCCFNIWRRPRSGEVNSKPDFTLKDITIIEHRRKKGEISGANKPIPEAFDYSMCNWGNGCLGKQPRFVGEFAQEVYFYCHNKKYLYEMLRLLEFETIRTYANSISAKRISVMRLYKYLKENIKGIE